MSIFPTTECKCVFCTTLKPSAQYDYCCTLLEQADILYINDI